MPSALSILSLNRLPALKNPTMNVPDETPIPDRAYSVDQAGEIERLAAVSFDVPGPVLMERAGRAAASFILTRYPLAQRIAIVCGTGNNGGDGYVLARLLGEARRDVLVYAPDDAPPRRDEARGAADRWRAAGGYLTHFDGLFPAVDLLVDALFGIGISQAPNGAHAQMIAAINAQTAPVLALDVPSGLDADNGSVRGDAVRAQSTLSFIVIKRGLLTGRAPAQTGRVILADLDLPKVLLACVPATVRVLLPADLEHWLPRRARDAHKGNFGHVLIVGGDEGYGGAVRLAAEAACRVGAGLVSVATRSANAQAILSARPEIMARGVSGPGELSQMLAKASVVVIGPGLGQSAWALTLLGEATERGLPTVLDADALNLLAQAACVLPEQVVITPHPGEAARLLDCSSAEIQADRFEAADKLMDYFQATVVLKGAGTLIRDRAQGTSICTSANPGMATGGTGDVLAGCIGGLLAQGLSAPDAARTGVLLHALAGEAAAVDGERGMLAGDLLPHLRRLANPRRHD